MHIKKLYAFASFIIGAIEWEQKAMRLIKKCCFHTQSGELHEEKSKIYDDGSDCTCVVVHFEMQKKWKETLRVVAICHKFSHTPCIYLFIKFTIRIYVSLSSSSTSPFFSLFHEKLFNFISCCYCYLQYFSFSSHCHLEVSSM